MDIRDIINSEQNRISAEKDVLYFDGGIEKDDEPGFFRIYPDPRIKQLYLKVKMEHVKGDIYKYDDEAIKEAGLSPVLGFTPNNEYSIYQIPIKKEAEIECITIQKAKVGVEYPKKFAELMSRKKDSHSKSGCGCQNKPPQQNSLAYCNVFGPPCDPACQWCNDMDNTCKCSSCCV